MTWTPPAVDRTPPPWTGDEWTALTGWLDHQRSTLLAKCAGLDAQQLRMRSAPPSTLSLLGLVRHMADVERIWFRRRVGGEDVGDLYWTAADPDADFNDVDSADPAAAFAALAAEVDAARAVLPGRSLDEVFTSRRRDGTETRFDLRGVLVHMIEEYARHNGHADLLRERIDGVTDA
jgi:uncharacterized damage-inducible protein DinB